MQKVLIGHWFLIPLCVTCDTIKTQGSGKALANKVGMRLAALWMLHVSLQKPLAPVDVTDSIMDCGK